ncbi:MAG: hypothetical protein Q4C42_02835 [Clostridia bacterium]|nr:hypothetical protein [Clostridia bacterium]
MKRLLSLVLSLCLVMSLCAVNISAYSVTGKKTGTNHTIGKYYYSDNDVPYITDADTLGDDLPRAFVVFHNGEHSELSYYGFENMGKDYYKVREYVEINGVGLINGKDESLISADAAAIDYIGSGDNISDRYLRVVIAEDTTENEKEAIMSIKETVQYMEYDMEEGLYTGYAMIYDLEKKDYVPDLVITETDKNCINPCADNLIYNHDGKSELISPEGKVLAEFDDEIKVSNITDGYFCFGNSIYNSEGKATFEGEKDFSLAGGKADHAVFCNTTYDSGSTTYTLFNGEGNPICVLPYSVYDCGGGVVKAVNNDDETILLTLDGTELFRSKEGIFEAVPGIWYCETEDDVYTLIDKDGIMGENFTDNKSPLVHFSNGRIFVINDRDFTLDLSKYEDYSVKDNSVVIAKSKKGNYTAFDLFTGKKITDGTYTKMNKTGDALFCMTEDETWDIYELTATE